MELGEDETPEPIAGARRHTLCKMQYTSILQRASEGATASMVLSTRYALPIRLNSLFHSSERRSASVSVVVVAPRFPVAFNFLVTNLDPGYPFGPFVAILVHCNQLERETSLWRQC